MTPKADRRRRELEDRRRLLRDRYHLPRVCEVRWDHRCQGAATDPHEPLSRAQGGSITDPANIVAACTVCHDLVHAHPEEARRRGWTATRSGPRCARAAWCEADTHAPGCLLEGGDRPQAGPLR